MNMKHFLVKVTVFFGLIWVSSVYGSTSPFTPKEPIAANMVQSPVIQIVKTPQLFATKRHGEIWSAYMDGQWIQKGDKIANRIVKKVEPMYVQFSDGLIVRLIGTEEEKAKIEVRYEK